MRVTSTEMQNNFGTYLKYVEANEEIIITKSRKDTAKIIPCHEDYSIKEKRSEYRSTGGWITYEEFLELTAKSENRFELIDGVLYNLASPSYKHHMSFTSFMVHFTCGLEEKDVSLSHPFRCYFL